MKFSNTIHIHRPTIDVFTYLAALENLPRWNYAIQETRKISSDPLGAGSKYQQWRTLPKPMEEELTIEVYEPHHRLVISGGFSVFQGVASYQLEVLENATRLTNEIELHAPGALDVLAGVTTLGIQHAVSQNLNVFKKLLEHPGQA